MSLATWVLLVKPGLIAAGFILAGGLVFLALAGARRRDAAAGVATRAAGVVVAGLSLIVLGGVFAFMAIFYAVTG